jgi:hypothetical protein
VGEVELKLIIIFPLERLADPVGAYFDKLSEIRPIVSRTPERTVVGFARF